MLLWNFLRLLKRLHILLLATIVSIGATTTATIVKLKLFVALRIVLLRGTHTCGKGAERLEVVEVL